MSEEVTTGRICKELGLNRGTFDAWLQRGLLDTFITRKKGKSNLFDKEKIYQWIAEKRSISQGTAKQEKTSNAPTLAQSKAIKEAYAAQLAKLDYEERVKNLVDIKILKRFLFNTARAIRNNLLTIPSRIASELAYISDDQEIEKIIQDELLQVLEEIQTIDVNNC